MPFAASRPCRISTPSPGRARSSTPRPWRLMLTLSFGLGVLEACTAQMSRPADLPELSAADGGLDALRAEAGKAGASAQGAEPSLPRRAEASTDAGLRAADAAAHAEATDVARGAAQPISNEAVLDVLSQQSYRTSGFRRLNSRPFPSVVAPGKSIVLWVSASAYDAYATVSMEHSGSMVALPQGTIIVREVYANDELDTLTLMLKLEAGAFALGGDWLYAATDPQGVVRMDATTGAPAFGLTERCGTCHLRRSHDDYLFGVSEGYLDATE